MTPYEALEALLSDTLVHVHDGPPCRVDGVYRATYEDPLRARVVDRHGLIHHYTVEHLEAVVVAA